MIQRMDRNNNGMLEPEEMEGPAQMMIARLQREDPSIRTDRPIPVSKILEAFERMRGGGGDRGDSREDTRAKLNEALTPPETLVPGFGEPVVLEPVLGFGPAAELLAVTVTPEDRKSAEELLQRYDRNRDGALSGEEISRRWSGNPMDFDRNGDGKLSLNELGIRAARLRVAEAEVQAASNRRSAPAAQRREDQPAEPADPYNGRRSFASTSRGLPEGLPGWFAERDTNGDQQVSMAEYSQQWTASLVAEFQSFDLNGDGVITPSECLAAIRGGATASSSGASESRASESRDSSRSRSRGSGGGPTSSSPPASSPAPAASSELDPKMLETAQRIIGRNDKNGDGVLTHDEWKEMLVDPTAADANQDGRITIEEYARWMQARSSR